MTKSAFALFKRFARDERGASLVEYSVLLGIITAAVIIVITTLSGQINTIFTNISASLGTTVTQTG